MLKKLKTQSQPAIGQINLKRYVRSSFQLKRVNILFSLITIQFRKMCR